jgi:hypothetical protein
MKTGFTASSRLLLFFELSAIDCSALRLTFQLHQISIPLKILFVFIGEFEFGANTVEFNFQLKIA